jgi:hypothetical protein
VSVNGGGLSPTFSSLVAQIKTVEAELRESAKGSTSELATIVNTALSTTEELLAPPLLEQVDADIRDAETNARVPSDQTTAWLSWATRHLVRLGELREAVATAPRLATTP